MFNTMFRRQTIGSVLFAATLATLPLAACTQSSTRPPTQAQTPMQTPRSFDSDPPEVVISASRAHAPIRK
jgi:hypothetical protein